MAYLAATAEVYDCDDVTVSFRAATVSCNVRAHSAFFVNWYYNMFGGKRTHHVTCTQYFRCKYVTSPIENPSNPAASLFNGQRCVHRRYNIGLIYYFQTYMFNFVILWVYN